MTEEERKSIVEDSIRTGKAIYTIEVLFRDRTETRRWAIANRTATEFMQFREKIFATGFAYNISTLNGKIIPPWDIIDILFDIQKKYIDY